MKKSTRFQGILISLITIMSVLLIINFAVGGATFSRVKTWTSGETLTASDLNDEFDNILDNLDPDGMDDASATAAAMRSVTDPYPASSESLATDLRGEIKRIRYQIKQITGGTYWYDKDSANAIWDSDGDTGIQAEESADEDILRFDVGGSQVGTMSSSGFIFSLAGNSTPVGTLNVETANSGATTPSTAGDDFVVENSDDGGISILTPKTKTGGIYFGDDDDSDVAYIKHDHSTGMMTFGSVAQDCFNIYGAKFYLNETENAYMTRGITINQAQYDNEIFSFKSSDVAHAMTGLAEADTYGTFSKKTKDAGGLKITGYRDGDSYAGGALVLDGILGENADTTKSSSGNAPVEINASITSGTTTEGAVNADGNLMAVQNSYSTRFIIDEDGDFHYDGSDQGAYDDEEDALAIRDLNAAVSSREDEYLKYSRDMLEDMGIIAYKKGGDIVTNPDGTMRVEKDSLFISGKSSEMLKLGAIAELYRVVNYLCDNLGLNYNEIKQIAKLEEDKKVIALKQIRQKKWENGLMAKN